MIVEEKVGQLFMIYVYGKTPTDTSYEQTNLGSGRGAKKFEEAIQKYHVDGIIYFNWTDNIGTPVDYAQVNALSNGIQKVVYNFIKAILYYQQIVKQIFVLYNIVNG